jgi:hypothetical protein
VKVVETETNGWKYNRISPGYPGIVRNGAIAKNPSHLGGGWKDFDFSKAFGCSARTITDAALQALAH